MQAQIYKKILKSDLNSLIKPPIISDLGLKMPVNVRLYLEHLQVILLHITSITNQLTTLNTTPDISKNCRRMLSVLQWPSVYSCPGRFP